MLFDLHIYQTYTNFYFDDLTVAACSAWFEYSAVRVWEIYGLYGS